MRQLIRRNRRHADLSAYLDGALGPEDRRLLENRLLADSSLREELEGLREVKDLVASLETAAPPRSFALTADALGAPARPTGVGVPSFSRFAFGAAAGAALVTLFAFVAAPGSGSDTAMLSGGAAESSAVRATAPEQGALAPAGDAATSQGATPPVGGSQAAASPEAPGSANSKSDGSAAEASSRDAAPADDLAGARSVDAADRTDRDRRWRLLQVAGAAISLAAAAAGGLAWNRQRRELGR